VIVGGQEIECITFDLDDTLWLCEPVVLNAEFVFYTWLREHCPRIAENYSASDLVQHRRGFFAGFPDMSHDFSWLRRRWMESLAEEFGYTRDGLLDEGFEVFLVARNDIQLFAGADEILESVSRRYTCGTITNGNADVARIGIDHYFDFSITAAGAGAAKPNPVIFRAAMKAAGVPAEKILHVGDDPERDIRGAAAAGMKTLWINPQGAAWKGAHRPDAEIRIISELADILTH
jgi:putative hydrolase of the HAD superfamily